MGLRVSATGMMPHIERSEPEDYVHRGTPACDAKLVPPSSSPPELDLAKKRELAFPVPHGENVVHAELVTLRLIHIVGGVFWVGSAMFTTFFLLPAVAKAGPSAGQVVLNLQKRRAFVII